jgi:hypothetical protein
LAVLLLSTPNFFGESIAITEIVSTEAILTVTLP